MRSQRWALALSLGVSFIAACSDDPMGADAGTPGADAGRRDGATDAGLGDSGVRPPPTELATGIWMLHELREDDTPSRPCWSTLVEFEITNDQLRLGERVVECEIGVTRLSALELDIEDEQLLFAGQVVGAISTRAFSLTLPGDAGEVSVDLSRPSAQYREVLRSVVGDTIYLASIALQLDGRPIALESMIAGREDSPATGRLHAAKLPDSIVSFSIATAPSAGQVDTLDVTSGELAYTPVADAFGQDYAEFQVTDGVLPSTRAPIVFDVGPVPDPPVARGAAYSTPEDTVLEIELDAFDVDLEPVEVSIVTNPMHGVLDGSGLSLSYTPETDYNGTDFFEYRVSDGVNASEVATIALTITPVNDAPIAIDQQLTTRGIDRVGAVLAATDVDDTTLTFAIATAPQNGTVSGTPPAMIYRANAGFAGTDSFTFTASDGTNTSAEATITIDVAPAVYGATTLTADFGISIEVEHRTANKIYFSGYNSPSQGTELWGTDGTVNGTQRVVATPFGYSGRMFSIGAEDFYTLNVAQGTLQIFRVDGASVADIPNPDPARFTNQVLQIGGVVEYQGAALLLLGWNNPAGENVCEVWSTTGVGGLTERLYALPVGPSGCSGLWALGDHQYMSRGSSLMRMQAATEPLAEFAVLPTDHYLRWTFPALGQLYFGTVFSTPGVTGSTRYELWKTDGTALGTVSVNLIEDAYIAREIASLSVFGSELFYLHRKSLYATDGVPGTRRTVTTFPVSSYGASAFGALANIGGVLYMRGGSDVDGGEPWRSDGTTAGTSMLADIRPGNTGGSLCTGFEPFDGFAFFGANDGVLGCTLWRSNGSTAGTERAIDVEAETLLGVIGTTLIVYGAPAVTAVDPL